MLDIIIDENSLRRKSELSQVIFGVIYFVSDDYCFPAKNWTDFVSSFMLSWLRHVTRFQTPGYHKKVISFYDDLFEIGLEKHKKGWKITFINGQGKTPIIEKSHVISNEELVAATLKATDQVIWACTNNGLESTEIRSLIELRNQWK